MLYAIYNTSVFEPLSIEVHIFTMFLKFLQEFVLQPELTAHK